MFVKNRSVFRLSGNQGGLLEMAEEREALKESS